MATDPENRGGPDARGVRPQDPRRSAIIEWASAHSARSCRRPWAITPPLLSHRGRACAPFYARSGSEAGTHAESCVHSSIDCPASLRSHSFGTTSNASALAGDRDCGQASGGGIDRAPSRKGRAGSKQQAELSMSRSGSRWRLRRRRIPTSRSARGYWSASRVRNSISVVC